MSAKMPDSTDGKPVAQEERATEEDRLFSPSVTRNRDPIREVLTPLIIRDGAVLEIAAGTGEHAVHLAAACPDIAWQPSDPDTASRRSIAAWRASSRLTNLRAPLAIDVLTEHWWHRTDLPQPIHNILCINMIHIAPFAAARGLITGAQALLPTGGRLFLYGPFKREGQTAPSNQDFDKSLKSRDASWGVRDLDLEIQPLAVEHSLTLHSVTPMPANNLTVVFEKR